MVLSKLLYNQKKQLCCIKEKHTKILARIETTGFYLDFLYTKINNIKEMNLQTLKNNYLRQVLGSIHNQTNQSLILPKVVRWEWLYRTLTLKQGIKDSMFKLTYINILWYFKKINYKSSYLEGVAQAFCSWKF